VRIHRVIVGWLSLIGGVVSSSAADQSTFFQGSRAYESGDYPAAKQAWTAPGRTSSGTLHNLGNAEYKIGNPGPAILAWERALALAPGRKNTAANLRFARSEAGLGEPQYPWHERYSMLLSPGVWLTVASLTFWGGIVLLALPPLLKRSRTSWTQAAAVVAIALFLLSLPALAGLLSRSRLGVVLATDTELRLTPTKEAEVLGKLAAGELARVEKSRGNYVYIRGASDRAGWVQRGEFERIWP
jgi:hypothetical protein